MNIDNIIWFLGSLAQAGVIALLAWRLMYRIFPFFFTYSVWTLIGSAATFVVFDRYSASSPVYVSAYLIDMLVDSVLLFAVLVELAWSVLRPLRSSLPRSALVVVSFLILAAGAAIWPFATPPGFTAAAGNITVLLTLKQTVSALSVLIFLVFAAGSQLLALGWRDRELQIATGLGLYSLVGVVVVVLHTYPNMRNQYNLLDQIMLATYLCALFYWIFSFAQSEEERRQMSPQMQNLLIAVAGAAHSTRVAMTSSCSTPRKDRDQQ